MLTNLEFFFKLPNVGIIGMCHHARLFFTRVLGNHLRYSCLYGKHLTKNELPPQSHQKTGRACQEAIFLPRLCFSPALAFLHDGLQSISCNKPFLPNLLLVMVFKSQQWRNKVMCYPNENMHCFKLHNQRQF